VTFKSGWEAAAAHEIAENKNRAEIITKDEALTFLAMKILLLDQNRRNPTSIQQKRMTH
jgi:hypothetical protein